ncbi:alpha-soluble NSF attachment protein-like [Tubulanus polymorphus]|uniref:alpha-soluble NSF attachment protein-like n=1 Tax=Tubulanus polymorphus TaxID=672921 RepID=UPI003DA5ADED
MATDPNEKKGLELLAQADKKMRSAAGFFSSIFGGGSKIEEAAELYVKAAYALKMAKKWKAAGDAFCQSSELKLRMQSKHEAATHYVEAATCYKKADPNEAIRVMMKAIEIYTDMGRFTVAAKHHMTVAEIYETELVDMEQAISNYEKAADYYKGEESNSSASKCLTKVAHFCAQIEMYDKAVEIFEEIGRNAMDNKLLHYGAKEYFFKAALCHMCIDLLNAQQAMAKYEEMFPVFSGSREHKFLKTLMQACEDNEIDVYTEAVKDYDSISRLDTWLTTILLRIKKGISDSPDLT